MATIGAWLARGLVALAAGCQGVTAGGDTGTSETGEAGTEPTGGTTAVASEDASSGSGSSGSSGDADEGCELGDLAAAPAPVMVDGAVAVPIDVLALAGQFTIDVASETAEAAAQLRFRVGPVAGRPIFDLRQQGFLAGELDGVAIAAEDMPEHDLGGGPGTEMRVLSAALPACSEHTLSLRYPLAQPPGYSAPAPEFKEDGVAWDFGFSDIAPRMFLEHWLPANLIHDRHPISLTLEIVGGAADQRVISNGEVEALGPGRWQIELPPHSTAMSPMLVLSPGGRVESSSMSVALAGGEVVDIEVHRSIEVSASSEALHELLAQSFADFSASTGAYAFARFTAFVRVNAGMEYDGGATSSVGALRHELFHSWYGRGVKPVSARDGWIDEAWTEYNTGFPSLPVQAIDPAAPPTTLRSERVWSRTTPFAAYDVGKRVFAAIAEAAGLEPLRASMREFYAMHALGQVSSEQLERHLHCTLATPAVRALFHRHVYGLSGEPASPPADYCAM